MAIEVWPCQELPEDFYHWMPMNDTCTKEIPLKFLHGSEEHAGYLDPVTNIIHQQGASVDCALSEEVPLTIGSVTYLYDYHSGTLSKPSQLRILPFVHWNFSELLPLQPTIFHEITMYKWTELQSTVSLNDVLGTLDKQRQILDALGVRTRGDPPIAAQEAIAGIMNQGFFGFLSGLALNWWQVWVFVCCLYVTLVIIISHCCPLHVINCLKVNVPDKMQKLKTWWKTKMKRKPKSRSGKAVRFIRKPGEELIQFVSNTSDEGPTVPRRPDPSLLHPTRQPALGPSRTLRAIEGPRVNLPAIEWPPKLKSIEETAFCIVSTAQGGEAPLPPLVPVRIQGILVAALLDTGSSVTLIDEELADQLPFHLLTEPALMATSITGHALELIKAAQVEIQMGRRTRTHTIHVVRGSPHRCVLGIDLLPKFGLMSLDLEAGKMYIGKEVLPLGGSKLAGPWWARVKEQTTIPPYSEVLVACIPTTLGRLKPAQISAELLFEVDEEEAKKKNILVARALVKPHQGQVPVKVMNPWPYPIILWPHTRLGKLHLLRSELMMVGVTNAHPRRPSTGGPGCTSFTHSSVKQGDMQQLIQERISFTDSMLDGQKKQQLIDLIEQYQDVFAWDKMELGRTSAVKHHIDTGETIPIKQRPYRVPLAKRDEIAKQIDAIKEQGVVEESYSPWSSPVVLVLKKDQTI